MSIIHIVLFGFKANTTAQEKKTAADELLALQQRCIHPATGKPYILSLKGGKDNSVELLQNGSIFGFVFEFASVEDRDYYSRADPAHLAYKNRTLPLVGAMTVLDFVPGVF